MSAVRNDGMVHAATFQKDAHVKLTVIQVPPQLRRLEFARTSPSGNTPPTSLLQSIVLFDTCIHE